MRSPQFRPEAAADLEEAVVWYESQERDLGNEFLERIKDILARIQKNPYQFPVVLRETRRAMLNRFPYSVFFRVTDEMVLIVAVMHFRRSSRRWMRRR